MQSLQWHFPAPQALAEPGELLQEGAGRSPGDGMLGGQRWQPAALPRGGWSGETKELFPLSSSLSLARQRLIQLGAKQNARKRMFAVRSDAAVAKLLAYLLQPFVLPLPQMK